MNFKEAYQDDLDNAFFDEDEFASKHTIDGEEYTIVLVDTTCADAQTSSGRKSALNPKEAAVNKISYIVYIKGRDVKRKLTTNAMITLDGKKYFIQDVKYNEGVYRLEIGIHAV